MKLKIWNEESVKDCSDEQLFLKLTIHQQHEDIFIDVVAKNGETIKSGHLLTIDQDLKCLIIADNLNELIPLKTDIDGMLLHLTEDQYRERAKGHMHHHFMQHMMSSMSKEKDETVTH